MKKRKLIVAVILAFTLALFSVIAVACGGSGTTLEEGTYSGTYKCSYTKDGTTTSVGCVATFDVDANNYLWDIAIKAADPEGDITYSSPSLGQRPWDATKILGQFSGAWTVDDFMKIEVVVDANGVPSGEIKSSKGITVGTGFELGTAVVILAVQNGIETANKI